MLHNYTSIVCVKIVYTIKLTEIQVQTFSACNCTHTDTVSIQIVGSTFIVDDND